MTNPTESPQADLRCALKSVGDLIAPGQAVDGARLGQCRTLIKTALDMSSPQELPPLQFAIQDSLGMWLRDPVNRFFSSYIADAFVFSDREILNGECRSFNGLRLAAFREYTRTSPPSREVVELEGDVCLKGLKFALAHENTFWTGSIWSALAQARLHDTIERARRSVCLHGRIVGIREVPGKSVVTREEVR